MNRFIAHFDGENFDVSLIDTRNVGFVTVNVGPLGIMVNESKLHPDLAAFTAAIGGLHAKLRALDPTAEKADRLHEARLTVGDEALRRVHADPSWISSCGDRLAAAIAAHDELADADVIALAAS